MRSARWRPQPPADPKLPFYSRKCKCGACHEYFNSPKMFDRHRIGRFGVDRRCMTPGEMLQKGFSISYTGHWTSATAGVEDEISDGPLPAHRLAA